MAIAPSVMASDVPRKLSGSAAVILDPAGQVLLVHHTYGKLNWELPGGVAELNESPVDTVRRELKEETGLDVVATRLTGVYYEPANPHGEFIHFVFRCRVSPSTATPQPDGKEISELSYWPVDALPRPMSSFTYRRITDALARRRAPAHHDSGTSLAPMKQPPAL